MGNSLYSRAVWLSVQFALLGHAYWGMAKLMDICSKVIGPQRA